MYLFLFTNHALTRLTVRHSHLFSSLQYLVSFSYFLMSDMTSLLCANSINIHLSMFYFCSPSMSSYDQADYVGNLTLFARKLKLPKSYIVGELHYQQVSNGWIFRSSFYSDENRKRKNLKSERLKNETDNTILF